MPGSDEPPGWKGMVATTKFVDLYLGGARIEANFPMGPRAGCGLNVTLLSYRDSLDMGINIDPAAVSDPATLLDCFDESFGALLDVAG